MDSFGHIGLGMLSTKIIRCLHLDLFEKSIGPRLSLFKTGFPLIPGRLVSSLEGEGKRRVFAISNYVNQRLLLPVHEWTMTVLRHIEMDGTFNQLRPFFKLKGKNSYFCYDLKAATDRVPLLLLFEVFQHCFDRSVSLCEYDSRVKLILASPQRTTQEGVHIQKEK